MDAAEKILDAADELFGQIGFDATTTREIAERAGVNKALIHYHYSTKDGLLERLLDRYYDELALTLAVPLEPGPDLRERFARMVDSYVDFLAANQNFSRIVQREASGGRHLPQIQRRMTPLFQAAIAAVERQYPACVGSPLSAPDLLASFYGMIIATFTFSGVLEHLIDGDPQSRRFIEARKAHLAAMLDLAFDALEALDTLDTLDTLQSTDTRDAP